jgi:thioesterase-3
MVRAEEARMSVTQIKIRGYHEDRFGHVNNARYLELLEEARWADFEARGVDVAFLKRNGVFPVVVRLTVSYRRPASAGDTVDVSVDVKSAGRRKVVLAQEIRLAGTDTVCAEAEIEVVFLDEKTGRPVPLGEPFYAIWPELRPTGGDSA